MIRLAWRQFRMEAVVAVAAVLVVALVLAVTAPHLFEVYDAYVRCLSSGCIDPPDPTRTDESLQFGLAIILLAAPALAGIFIGAPLVARELETGTSHLAWTQSVSRTRWLAVKLGLAGLSSTLVVGVLTAMAAWWTSPIENVSQDRFSPVVFGMFGIVPLGYALFACALGATLGLLIRKAVPAMAVTLASYAAARIGVTYGIRPYFKTPVSVNVALGPDGAGGYTITPNGVQVAAPNVSIPNGWVYSTSIVDKAGYAPSSGFLSQACAGVGAGPRSSPIGGGAGGSDASGPLQHCLSAIGANLHGVVSYQPAGQYWVFQLYETALFVVFAVALASLSVWWVRHRAA